MVFAETAIGSAGGYNYECHGYLPFPGLLILELDVSVALPSSFFP